MSHQFSIGDTVFHRSCVLKDSVWYMVIIEKIDAEGGAAYRCSWVELDPKTGIRTRKEEVFFEFELKLKYSASS